MALKYSNNKAQITKQDGETRKAFQNITHKKTDMLKWPCSPNRVAGTVQFMKIATRVASTHLLGETCGQEREKTADRKLEIDKSIPSDVPLQLFKGEQSNDTYSSRTPGSGMSSLP